jgi:hypothetical protein
MDIDKMQKIGKIGSGNFGDVILYQDDARSMVILINKDACQIKYLLDDLGCLK